MSEVIWFSSNSKPSPKELIADYERLTEEHLQIKKEIVKEYFRLHGLTSYAVNKPANIKWTEKEFSEMLAKLKKASE